MTALRPAEPVSATAQARRRELPEAWRRRLTAGALVAIVLLSCAVATRWVFLVPIFQAPDEPVHYDYVISIYSAGGLLPLSARPFQQGLTDLDTNYLWHGTGIGPLSLHPQAKVPPGYGTGAYFARIDAHAPTVAAEQRSTRIPQLARLYPYGYYALDGAWLALIGHFTSSVVALFFAARLLSVVLFACSLLLSFGVARELGLGRVRALAITFVIGLFPMATMVASYIQPDNLSLTTVSLSFFAGLRLRRALNGGTGREQGLGLALLAVALGLLFVTKYQYFLSVAAAVVPMVAVEVWVARRSLVHAAGAVGILAVPALLLGAVQLWITRGTSGAVSGVLATRAHADILGRLMALPGHLHGVSLSFWGDFGWLDTLLIFGNLRITAVVDWGLLFFSALVIVLGLVRLGVQVVRLSRVALGGQVLTAVRGALANPVINGLLVFTAFELWFDVEIPDFGLQGRYWFPYLLALGLVAVVYIPQLIPQDSLRGLVPRGRLREDISRLILAGLVIYSVVGSAFALQTLHERYYGTGGLAAPPIGIKVKAGPTLHPSAPTLDAYGGSAAQRQCLQRPECGATRSHYD